MLKALAEAGVTHEGAAASRARHRGDRLVVPPAPMSSQQCDGIRRCRCTSWSTAPTCATVWTTCRTTFTTAHATTAGATPAELARAYQQALTDSGGDGVVARAHLGGAVEHLRRRRAGRARARRRGAGGGLAIGGDGYRLRRAGRGAGRRGRRRPRCRCGRGSFGASARTHAFIVVHRLDNLRRSGRIGGAAAWLGTALSLKPLLCIDDGRLVLAQRVRTVTKAVAAMLDQVCGVVGDAAALVAVHHVADPDAAREVATHWRSGCRPVRRRSSPTWGRCWPCTWAPAPSASWCSCPARRTRRRTVPPPAAGRPA